MSWYVNKIVIITVKSVSVNYTMWGKFGGEYLCKALFLHYLINLSMYVFYFLGRGRLFLSKHRKGDARGSPALHHHRGQHVSSLRVSGTRCVEVSLSVSTVLSSCMSSGVDNFLKLRFTFKNVWIRITGYSFEIKKIRTINPNIKKKDIIFQILA